MVMFPFNNPYNFGGTSGNIADPVDDVLQKKKKSWLDSLGANLAGDRYIATTDSDQRLAMNQALIAIGRQFSQAGAKGDWMALGQALGSGVADASDAFHQTMLGLSKQRVANEQVEYNRKKQGLDLRKDTVLTEGAEREYAEGTASREVIKRELQSWQDAFDATIGDEDLTPQERLLAQKVIGSQMSVIMADPSPANFAALGVSMHDLMSKAGRQEEADRLVHEQFRSAAKSKYPNLSEEEGIAKVMAQAPIDEAHRIKLQEADLRYRNAASYNLEASGRESDANAAAATVDETGYSIAEQKAMAQLTKSALSANKDELKVLLTEAVTSGDKSMLQDPRVVQLGISNLQQAEDVLLFHNGVIPFNKVLLGRGNILNPGQGGRSILNPPDNFNPADVHSSKGVTVAQEREYLAAHPDEYAKGAAITDPKKRAIWLEELRRKIYLSLNPSVVVDE